MTEREKEKNMDWFKEYDRLRDMHSILKSLTNDLIGGIPHFAGDQRELPAKYRCLLNGVHDALYKAEEYAAKMMYR